MCFSSLISPQDADRAILQNFTDVNQLQTSNSVQGTYLHHDTEEYSK
jgi:hypothetical protein